MIPRRPLICLSLLWLLLACSKTEKQSSKVPPDSKAASSAKAAGAAKVAPKASSATSKAKANQHIIARLRVPPPLSVIPGEGLGPVRFGATLATIERLLNAPCTEKIPANDTQNLVCRYRAHAVEFHIKDGAVHKMHAHGSERSFGEAVNANRDTYGIFNGMVAPGIALGMYKKVVSKELGPAQRVETLEQEGVGVVARHHYQGMTLEYDRLKNGNIVLASVILEKPTDKSR